MICRNNQNAGALCETGIYALLILPAVTLGVLAMIRGGVSPALWGQQAAAWFLFALLVRPLQRVFRKIPAQMWSILFLLPLAAALFGAEAGGARRWIDLGVFQVNAAQLILPALLVVLCSVKFPYPVLLAAAAILCAQPSAAQLIAFSAAAIPVLWKKEKKLWGWGSALLLAALIIWAIRIPVALEPVPYCEGILTMLGEMSPLMQAVGWAALAAIPAFWLARFRKTGEKQMLCLSVYYAASVLFAFTGEYPVLLMGFGLSPIVGYYIACVCCLSAAKAKSPV